MAPAISAGQPSASDRSRRGTRAEEIGGPGASEAPGEHRAGSGDPGTKEGTVWGRRDKQSPARARLPRPPHRDPTPAAERAEARSPTEAVANAGWFQPLTRRSRPGGAWSARGSHPVCSKPPPCTPRGSRWAPGTCGWVVGKGRWESGTAGCPAPLPVPHRATQPPPHQGHFYLFLPKRSKNPQQDPGCAQAEVPEVPQVPAAPGWAAGSEASGGATEPLPARSGKLLHPHTETCRHGSRASGKHPKKQKQGPGIAASPGSQMRHGPRISHGNDSSVSPLPSQISSAAARVSL